MIEIRVFNNKVTVKGHANYAKNGGDDIVCSAISTLFQSLVLGVENISKDKMHYQLKPGDSWIEFETFSNDSIILHSNFVIAVNAIAEEYPENVQIILEPDYKIS